MGSFLAYVATTSHARALGTQYALLPSLLLMGLPCTGVTFLQPPAGLATFRPPYSSLLFVDPAGQLLGLTANSCRPLLRTLSVTWKY
jgi:hypothetical protein